MLGKVSCHLLSSLSELVHLGAVENVGVYFLFGLPQHSQLLLSEVVESYLRERELLSVQIREMDLKDRSRKCLALELGVVVDLGDLAGESRVVLGAQVGQELVEGLVQPGHLLSEFFADLGLVLFPQHLELNLPLLLHLLLHKSLVLRLSLLLHQLLLGLQLLLFRQLQLLPLLLCFLLQLPVSFSFFFSQGLFN